MDPARKAKVARILGYTCLAVGLLNLGIAVVQALRDQGGAGSALLASGIGAMTLGIIMVAVARQQPTSEE